MSSLRFLIFLAIGVAVIGGVIAILIGTLGKKKNSQVPTYYANPNSYAPASSGSNTSKIFINSGVPFSNGAIGNISIDGKTMPLLYGEMPLEITIPTGRHHVIVEGGVYGDARIDRIIDFGLLDVWTVDLPGKNDPDYIRHQMISYSEYTKALVSSNFHITKKSM